MEPESGRATRRGLRIAERERRRISHDSVDPDYISRLEDFATLPHEEIFERVREMNPAALHEYSDQWVRIANSVGGAVSALHMTVQATLSEGMSGRMGSAADLAARRFVRRATDIEEVLRGAGDRIRTAAYGAEAVKRSVPPPPVSDVETMGATTTAFLSALTGGPGDDGFDVYKEEQHRLAVAALEANYVPTYPPAGSGVPAFVPAELPGANDGPVPVGAGGDVGMDAVRRLSAIGPVSTTEPVADSIAAIESQSPRSPVAEGYSRGVDDAAASAADVPATSADVSPNSTSTTEPNPSTRPATLDGPSTPASPKAGTPMGLPHSPGGTPNPGDPGRSIPSAPDTKTSTAPGTSEPTSRRNGSFYPGMYPPMAARGGDPDADRTSPEWLVWNREHELLGSPPPHTQPVIGAEIPAAQPDTSTPS
ncbi:hypothetical protein [Nocardia sp. NPDC050406]|uniref:hypothetical protein n=1 Tax=Nocardia sp. NPDC050406 TaxID=3364318 RepID=UPI0037B672BB